MHSKTRTIFITLLLAAPLFSAKSETIASIGSYKDYSWFIPEGKSVLRVGNAALFWVIGINSIEQIALGAQVLLACNASWISTPVQFSSAFRQAITPHEMYEYSRAEQAAVPLSTLDFFKPSEAPLLFANLVSKRARRICSIANTEPKNSPIPVAETTMEGGQSTSIALMTGTVERVGAELDVWMRTTQFVNLPALSASREPMEIDGTAIATRSGTGDYILDRRVFNCKSKSLAVYASAEYQAKSSTPTTWSRPRSEIQLKPVIPGSVGEKQLEAACAIYGN